MEQQNLYNSNYINKLAAIVAKNNEGEQDAIRGYAEVLATAGFPPEFYADIREITSDELNHAKKLEYWFTYLTGIVPNKN